MVVSIESLAIDSFYELNIVFINQACLSELFNQWNWHLISEGPNESRNGVGDLLSKNYNKIVIILQK